MVLSGGRMSGMRKGISRSLILPAPTDERLNKLCAEVDMNRNALVKLVADKATPDDIKRLLNR